MLGVILLAPSLDDDIREGGLSWGFDEGSVPGGAARDGIGQNL